MGIIIKIITIVGIIAAIIISIPIIVLVINILTFKTKYVRGIKETGKYIEKFLKGEINKLRIKPDIKMEVLILLNSQRTKIKKYEDKIFMTFKVRKPAEELRNELLKSGFIPENNGDISLYMLLPNKLDECFDLVKDFCFNTIKLNKKKQYFFCSYPRRQRK